jgi:hypothetical protein
MGRSLHTRFFIIRVAMPIVALLALACSADPPAPTPTPTLAAPTATRTPTRVPPSPTPPPTATPVPRLEAGQAIVVGGELRTRAEPAAGSEQKGVLKDHASVPIAETVRGENWLLGLQTWVTTTPAWASEWHRLEDGSYVYGAFVFTL